MQSSTSFSSGTSVPRLVVLIAAVVCAAAGYGLGHWQGAVATAAVAEQLSTAQADTKTLQHSLDAVEARTGRLEAHQRINMALEAFGRGDTSAGTQQLQEAERTLSSKSNEVSKPLADRLHALLESGEIANKTAELKALGKSLDQDLPLSRAQSGG